MRKGRVSVAASASGEGIQRLASGGGAWGRAGFLLAGTGGDFNVPSRTSALVCLTNTQEVIHAETVQIGMAKKYP